MPRAVVPSDAFGRQACSESEAGGEGGLENGTPARDGSCPKFSKLNDGAQAIPSSDYANLHFPVGLSRILGTLSVVAFHYYKVDGNPARWLDRTLYWGSSWVSFFFLLSGFLLGWRILHRPQAWSTFMRRRLATIYPVYVLTLLLAFANFGAKITSYGLRGLVAHLTLLQALYPPYVELWTADTNNFNSPSWFLSALFVGWLVLPSLARAASCLRGTCGCAVASAALYLMGPCAVQAFIISRRWYTWADMCSPRWCAVPWFKYWPFLHLPTFAQGVVLARWLQLTCQRERWGRGRVPPAPFQFAAVAGLTALAAVAMIWPMTGSDNTSWPSGTVGWFYFFHDGGLAPLHAMIILGAAAEVLSPMDKHDVAVMNHGIFEQLGKRTYAMYIMQQWTYGMLEYVIQNFTPQLSPERRTVVVHRVFLPTLFAVGYIVHDFVEVPYTRWFLSQERGGSS